MGTNSGANRHLAIGQLNSAYLIGADACPLTDPTANVFHNWLIRAPTAAGVCATRIVLL